MSKKSVLYEGSLTWKSPPPPQKVTVADTLSQILKTRAGEWAVVRSYPVAAKGTAYSWASQYKRRLTIREPDYAWEYTVRQEGEPEEVLVYMRVLQKGKPK